MLLCVTRRIRIVINKYPITQLSVAITCNFTSKKACFVLFLYVNDIQNKQVLIKSKVMSPSLSSIE